MVNKGCGDAIDYYEILSSASRVNFFSNRCPMLANQAAGTSSLFVEFLPFNKYFREKVNIY